MPAKRRICPEEVLCLDVIRTADILSRPIAQFLKSEGLSPTQYNVLRILRGSLEGLTCGEIGARMITRDPDVTRLVDRLEKHNLVVRGRESADRRVVSIRIAQEGLDLLARLDEPVQEMHRKLLGHLGRERRDALSALLALCRNED